MTHKPTVVIIEDNGVWLDIISKLIFEYFDVAIEKFSLFYEAEKRLMETSGNIDLLITDLFPSDTSRDPLGWDFAEFAHSIKNVPVIVITGQESYLKKALKNKNVTDAFYKGKFDTLSFVNSVRTIIPPNNFENKNSEKAKTENSIKPNKNSGFIS